MRRLACHGGFDFNSSWVRDVYIAIGTMVGVGVVGSTIVHRHRLDFLFYGQIWTYGIREFSLMDANNVKNNTKNNQDRNHHPRQSGSSSIQSPGPRSIL